MSNAIVADRMMEAMVINTSAKFMAGNYASAVEEATKYLNIIEEHTPEVKNTFGSVLVKLYCIRAQSLYMIGTASGDQTVVQNARQDMEKALQSVDVSYSKLSPTAISQLKENVLNIINADANIRKVSFKYIVEALPQSIPVTNTIMPHTIYFLTGAALWGLLVFIITKIGSQPAKPLVFILGVLLFTLIIMAAKGWNWLSQCKFGSYGHLLKYMTVVFFIGTVIGMLPISYWTGKGIFRLVERFRG